jgi:hypothetical protein
MTSVRAAAAMPAKGSPQTPGAALSGFETVSIRYEFGWGGGAGFRAESPGGLRRFHAVVRSRMAAGASASSSAR